MSVRAYRINKIEHEDSDTFNVWHDSELCSFLQSRSSWESNTQDSLSMLEVPVEALEEAIEAINNGDFDDDYKDESGDIKEVRAMLVKQLQKDIRWAKKHKEEYLMYYCF